MARLNVSALDSRGFGGGVAVALANLQAGLNTKFVFVRQGALDSYVDIREGKN